MRLLWLADVLRAAGLTVHEYDGWRGRGADTFGPVRGIVCHGTGGRLDSTDAGELRVLAITGSTSAPAVPIAQLYLSRTGQWWVVASGTGTGVKEGTAGPLKGYSDDAVLQIEAQHSTTEPWTRTQYESYVRGVAALVAHRVPGYDVPVARVVGHYEHQPYEKTDPWFDMGRFRADVVAALNQTTTEVTMFFLQAKGDPAVYISDGLNSRHVPAGLWDSMCQPLIARGVPLLVFDSIEVLRRAGGPEHAVMLTPEQLAELADRVAARMPVPPTVQEIAVAVLDEDHRRSEG